jgi:VWFA-related protein
VALVRSIALAMVVVGGVAGVELAGLQGRGGAPQAQMPQFRSGIDIVHLDVSVLDRNRTPVRGLKPADFTILENGKPRPISVFSAIEIADEPPPAAPWVRDVAPDVGTNDGITERRLFLIVFDDAAGDFDPRVVKNAKDIGRRMVESLGPSDLAAVIFSRDNRNSQDFTSNRARLLKAVDTFTHGMRDVRMDNTLYFQYSVNVLESAVDALSALPDRRKSIIYIGQGIPLALEGVVSGAMNRWHRQLSDTFVRAARANVNVYPIDVCGLRAQPPAPSAPNAGRGPRTCEPGIEVDYLRTIAENTGGRAVVETNDFAPALASILAENASYYLIGFPPADARPDGKIRRLEVRVNRPGVDVRTRNGYQAERPDAARRAALTSPLGSAMSGILPKSDLPLRMAAIPLAQPGRRELAVALVVGIRQPIREMATRNVEKVDLQIRAFNVEGRPFASKRLRADVTIRAEASGLAEYEVLTRLDLRPGRYQIRIAGSIGSLSTSGSLYHDVDVPNVGAQALAVSPLVWSASPSPVLATQGELKGLLPVVPTSRRSFLSSDSVSAFARVYQPGTGAPAAIRLRVLLRDETDRIVMNQQEDLPPERFAGALRSTDVTVPIPVATLPTGEYLLVFEATGPTVTARQQSRIGLRQ